MKTALSVIFISFCTILQAQYDSIYVNSLYRTYLLNVPASYVPSTATPLVIAMHGGLGSASNLQYTSKLTGKSNAAGFILVYPEGIKDTILGLRTWNGGNCCGYADSSNVDDVGFISALIDSLRLSYNIDTNRIYATGISNGAIMSYRLACELSNRIAAIAPVAGTLELPGCNPSRPVPIIQFHSDLDSSIFIKGGLGHGVSGHAFKPVNYGLMFYDTLNNCISGPDSTYYLSGSSYYYKKYWYNCACNAELLLYVTGDGGHSWPMGRQALYAGADTVSTLINANDSMWNFFMNHPLCYQSSGIREKMPGKDIRVYNTSTDNFVIEINTNGVYNLTLYNLLGEPVLSQNNIRPGVNTFSFLNLPNGIYITVLDSAQMSYTCKIIISR